MCDIGGVYTRRRVLTFGVGGAALLTCADVLDRATGRPTGERAHPDTSVVGYDHRVHGAEGLYVSDPSVFPSPPSVDPSVTIMAFAYVAAEHVHDAL